MLPEAKKTRERREKQEQVSDLRRLLKHGDTIFVIYHGRPGVNAKMDFYTFTVRDGRVDGALTLNYAFASVTGARMVGGKVVAFGADEVVRDVARQLFGGGRSLRSQEIGL
mgnify:CR=1 FL=1